jgi:hypothetical protein
MQEARVRFPVSSFTVDQFQNRVNELRVPVRLRQDPEFLRGGRIEASGHQKGNFAMRELLHQGARVLFTKLEVEDRGVDPRPVDQELADIGDRIGQQDGPGACLLEDPLGIEGDQEFVFTRRASPSRIPPRVFKR